jgi:CRP/FNR family transcriptional regulator
MQCGHTDCPFNASFSISERRKTLEHDCLVADSVKQVSFKKGEYVFSESQSSCCVYALTSGIAKIFSITPEGHEQITGFASPRKLMVGLRSLSQDHYSESVVAETNVTACKIRKRALLTAVAERPEVAFHLIDAMNAQLAMSRNLMKVSERQNPTGERLPMPFSRAELAGLLGLSEETVCRQMAKLKRDDVLYAPRGSIEIHDWDRLRAIADERDTVH